MGKQREVIRNGRVYLFDGNKYAGSRAAGSTDIPSPSDVELSPDTFIDSTGAVRRDYERMQEVIQERIDQQKLEELVSTAERYGIDLDGVDLIEGLDQVKYVEDNHVLLKRQQQVRTPEGQRELVADQSTHVNFLSWVARDDDADEEALLGLVTHPNTDDTILSLLAEHPNDAVRDAVSWSQTADMKTRRIASMAFKASNSDFYADGYDEAGRLTKYDYRKKMTREAERLFETNVTLDARQRNGKGLRAGEAEADRRRRNAFTGMLAYGIDEGILNEREVEGLSTVFR